MYACAFISKTTTLKGKLDALFGGITHYNECNDSKGSLMRLTRKVIASLLLYSLTNICLAKTDVPKSPEDGGPRNWVVIKASKPIPLRESASAKSKAVGRLRAGTILDNLGCQQAQQSVWCDVQPLGGGPRGYVPFKHLKPAVSPDGSVATGPDDSALRAGEKKFDATGSVPCAEYAGQPMTPCDFGVARAGGGYATVVVVKRASQKTRAIYFRMGKPIGADTSQADGYPKFSARKESDLNFISIGTERYEIPDAVVLGG